MLKELVSKIKRGNVKEEIRQDEVVVNETESPKISKASVGGGNSCWFLIGKPSKFQTPKRFRK